MIEEAGKEKGELEGVEVSLMAAAALLRASSRMSVKERLTP